MAPIRNAPIISGSFFIGLKLRSYHKSCNHMTSAHRSYIRLSFHHHRRSVHCSRNVFAIVMVWLMNFLIVSPSSKWTWWKHFSSWTEKAFWQKRRKNTFTKQRLDKKKNRHFWDGKRAAEQKEKETHVYLWTERFVNWHK